MNRIGQRSLRPLAPFTKWAGAAEVDRSRIGVASADLLAINRHGQETPTSRPIQAAGQNFGSSPIRSRLGTSRPQEPHRRAAAVTGRVRGTTHRAKAVAEGGTAKARHGAEGEERRGQGAGQRKKPHAEAGAVSSRLCHAAHPADAQRPEAFTAAETPKQAERARLIIPRRAGAPSISALRSEPMALFPPRATAL